MKDEQEMWHPTFEEVLEAHDQAGYISNIRNDGYLRSYDDAISKIEAVIEEAKQEQTIHRMAAVYLKRLIRNHPFSDGNHRAAYITTLRFLRENSEKFVPDQILETDEIVRIIKQSIQFEDIATVANWLQTGEL
jgi:death-on-curing family protein